LKRLNSLYNVGQNSRKTEASNFLRVPRVDSLIAKILALSTSKTARILVRMTFISASTTVLLLLIPFSPVQIALLFGLLMGALGTRYPKGAIALGILLSVPATVHQETVEAPMLVAYLLICIFPLAATRTSWINGFFVLVSIELTFIQPLCFFSLLPILVAGLAFSARDGAVTGLCASISIIFLLIIGAPLSGLIEINRAYTIKPMCNFDHYRLEDFKPTSLATVFANYTNKFYIDHWKKASYVGGEMLEKFLEDIFLWFVPGLWCVSGYVASKGVQWYRRINSFAQIPAILTAAAFPVIGYLVRGPSIGFFSPITLFAYAVFIGFVASLFHVQKETAALQDRAAGIKAKLDETRLTVQEISEIGHNTERFEGKIKELGSRNKMLTTLCQQGKVEEASTIVKNLEAETANLHEEITSQLSLLVQLDSMVLDYIIDHGGTISLSEAAINLNLSLDDLRASIEHLRRAGVIE